MTKQANSWKRGRGKLGLLAPLIGTWKAHADSPLGPVTWTRTFTRVLEGKFVQLTAEWKFKSRRYEEIALWGVGADGKLEFWSFTSDGKCARGHRVRATDLQRQALVFEAEMPAGRARLAFLPDARAGFQMIVEAQTKQGWKRFTDHHYLPV